MRDGLMQLLVSMAVVNAIFGCSSTQVTRRNIQPDKIAAEISSGCTKEDAIAFMKSNGFECSVVRDGEFEEMALLPGGEKVKTAHRNIDFVRCIRRDGGGANTSFVTTIWSFAIVLDQDDKAQQVMSRRDFVGL